MILFSIEVLSAVSSLSSPVCSAFFRRLSWSIGRASRSRGGFGLRSLSWTQPANFVGDVSIAERSSCAELVDRNCTMRLEDHDLELRTPGCFASLIARMTVGLTHVPYCQDARLPYS